MNEHTNADATKLVKLDESTASLSCSDETSFFNKDKTTMDTALELHIACANGASREHINSILLGRTTNQDDPQVTHLTYDDIDEITSSHFEKKEQQTALHLRELRHSSMITNLSLEGNNEQRQFKETDGNDKQQYSICFFDRDEMNGEHSKRQRDRSSRPLCKIDDESIPLTCEALSRKNEYSESLIKERQKLWNLHSRTFVELQREVMEIGKEKEEIILEIKIIDDAMKNLQEEHFKESQNQDHRRKSLLKRIKAELTWNRQDKPNSHMFEFKLGLATMNRNDLERYCYDLEERHVLLKKKYSTLYRYIFGEIDKRIELTLCVRIHGQDFSNHYMH